MVDASAETRAMFMVSYLAAAIAVQLHLHHRTEGKSGRKECKMHEREEVKAEIKKEKRKIKIKKKEIKYSSKKKEKRNKESYVLDERMWNLTNIIVEHRADILNIWIDNSTSRGHSVNVWSTKVYSGMPKAFPADIRKPNSRAQLRRTSENCKFVLKPCH
ncbi:hypothetical protein ALC53_06041 [Atta colombica]|uniref:Uncharacterized protein n=1 Tax=Atta colombica TaxID=520822 RepID=A0A195BHL1_9HYME|nr:hypothetical protein ALC53_06041 [Atta colombica]